MSAHESATSETTDERGVAPQPYRDASLPVETRIDDLVGRMTLAEKAGMLFQTMIAPGPIDEANPHMGIASGDHMIGDQHMSHFNVLGTAPDTRSLAEWTNALQRRAAATRLGIPVTLSTDPRNHFTDNLGTAARAGAFSQWPETLGLAAIGSVELVEAFADTARQEYLAVGIRLALHPQVDLATEPRWSRIGATFGEDAALSGELVAGYIRGFQGAELGPQSVSTMTKHFPGGGPQLDGEDPHFTYGREQVYPGDNFDYHLIPFRAAIAAGAAQMMPYYGMPVGTAYEAVGFAFNREIITGLLREELGFDGIVCTDWGLITDTSIMGQDMPGRAWGLEHLDELARAERILEAGCDQFGGEARPELVIELVEQGRVSEGRLDVSVRRLLREKFLLGLFEQPFVDVEAASGIVGNPAFVAAGEAAQRQAFTVLTNVERTLPVRSPRPRLYLEGVDPEVAAAYGDVVADPAQADLALLRLETPYEPRPGGFEAMFHAGSLDIPSEQLAQLRGIAEVVPTVIDMHLDRPAILTGIVDQVAALVASFGGSDAAFLDVVFGKAEPIGTLPFDLPRSMAAVEASRSDVPFDTEDPLFRFGHGLRYS